MAAPRKPIRRQIGRNAMHNSANKNIQPNLKHQRTIQEEKALRAATGNAIKTGRTIVKAGRKAKKLIALAQTTNLMKSSRYAIGEMEEEEFQQLFQELEQFENDNQLLQSLKEGHQILPERFSEFEKFLSPKEKILFFRLLRKYFEARKKFPEDAPKLANEANKIISKAKLRKIGKDV